MSQLLKAPVLRTEHLSIEFGGLKAVTDFQIELQEGELVGLIGPNGAGKTTVFNMLTGVYAPTAGRIWLRGEDVTGKKPEEMVAKGITRTFQNIRLFKKMTVLDNVKAAFDHTMSYPLATALLRLPGYWREEREIEEKARALLAGFGMEHLGRQIAENLPYGQQRKLEIARAMATGPQVLLLDEPAAGMNPTETAELMQTISLIREKYHITILLIEHDMSLVMGICQRIIVLNYGQILAAGSPAEVTQNAQVISAYLGS